MENVQNDMTQYEKYHTNADPVTVPGKWTFTFGGGSIDKETKCYLAENTKQQKILRQKPYPKR